MITLRPAKIADIPAILDLAIESVRRNPLPVKISREAMTETAHQVIGKAMHFAWVAEQDGQVVASVCAQSAYGFWFERQQCSVLLYYGRAPRSVSMLLLELARWIKSRPAIKVAVIELEPDAFPSLVRLVTRLGFDRQSINATYVRDNPCPKS